MTMTLPIDWGCLSCRHSRCIKDKPTWCVKTNTEAKGRCALYEAIAGRVIPK
jgi:hypothetical protein